jgi:hypothetical protein
LNVEQEIQQQPLTEEIEDKTTALGSSVEEKKSSDDSLEGRGDTELTSQNKTAAADAVERMINETEMHLELIKETDAAGQADLIMEKVDDTSIAVTTATVDMLDTVAVVKIEKEADASASTENNQDESELSNSDAVADVIAAMELSGTSTLITNRPAASRNKKPKSSTGNKPAAAAAAVTASAAATPVKSETSSSNVDIQDPTGQKRRKKDPSAPKAPLNGYLVYFNKERTEMHQRQPHIGFGELTKIIANKWKELPGDEKQRYTVEAEMDKERYVKEMADYKKTETYKQYLKGIY